MILPDPTLLLSFLSKANQLAQNSQRQVLIEGTLDLLLEYCQAESALVFWYDSGLYASVQRGKGATDPRNAPSPSDDWKKIADLDWIRVDSPTQLTAAQSQAVSRALNLEYPASSRILLFPMPLLECKGVLLLFYAAFADIHGAQILLERMRTEIEKARLLEISRQREERLKELNSILGEMGAILTPQQVLHTLIEQARTFLNVEATSLFLIDTERGDLVLEMASQADKEISVEKVRVPFGKGIIGCAVKTGESLIVNDAQQDQRHYSKIDHSSGFNTRSILAVPLRTRPIHLGADRGISSERIIGGLEAINKRDGSAFQPEDVELLQFLARGAATILVIAQLYSDANNLFMDTTQALVAAIDAKDPYTEGHSLRVSKLAAEIARALHLPAEEIYTIRLGAMLHDVGKIGIPDHILAKPSSLDSEEFEIIKQHTLIGEKIMSKVRSMQAVLPALVGHHERVDGKGYPRGLKGDQIPLMSRIIAVADVFDAMTSDRPYHKAMNAQNTFAYLYANVGRYFDGKCVDALKHVYQHGKWKLQTGGLENKNALEKEQADFFADAKPASA